MIAVDTNPLVYAHRRESRHHEAARLIVRELAEGRERWAIPWPCLYEFFSVVTNPRIWKEAASSPDQAWRQLDAWTASPSVSLLTETADFLPHDAKVAALCVAHGAAELLTVDRDFALVPELPTRDPLRTAPV